MNRFANPTESEIKALLARVQSIAVVGLSPKANRPSHRVAAALQGYGYRIIPVRPLVSEVLGEQAYADLYQVPGPPWISAQSEAAIFSICWWRI